MSQDPHVHRLVTSLESYEVKLSEDVEEFLQQQFVAAGDPQRLSLILQAMKRPPKRSTIRVNNKHSNVQSLRQFTEEYIETWKFQSGHAADSIKVVVALHAILSDVVTIDLLSDEPSQSYRSKPEVPAGSLRAFQHWPQRERQGWPMTHRAVICDIFCGEAVLRGSDIYVRGVLAADPGIREGEMVAVYTYVGKTKLARGRKVVLDASEQPTTANDEVSKGPQFIYLGVGTSKCSRSEYFQLTEGLAVQMSLQRAGPILPPLSNIPGFPQNLPSMIVAHCLELRQGQTILDMCAAPGGKTCHIASLVDNMATIVACDKSQRKVIKLKEMFRQQGATCITALAMDTTDCCPEGSYVSHNSIIDLLAQGAANQDSLLRIERLPPNSFDRILLDAPCSALGLRPKLHVAQTTTKSLISAANYQKLFIKSASLLLKPGGILTYSTCTINALENEVIVRHVLDAYPSMKLVAIDIPMGLPGLKGQGLDDYERLCVRRFDPADTEADSIGFFVAKFRKLS